ncbi:MAG: carboxy-S-adenosyl-L-methionine synthase CmoA [Candidatus Hydrogenedentota bacterium]
MSNSSVNPASQDPRDEIFAKPLEQITDFNFGKETAAVFDDMLDRSVPFYGEIQRMISELAADFAKSDSAVYDLGCSTCNTFLQIAPYLPPDARPRFVGLDSSQEMLDKARSKLMRAGFNYDYDLRMADLNEGVVLEEASVAIMTLTLQFLRPMRREPLVKSIYDGLRHQGALIIVEKVLGEDSTFNRLFIKHYYEMKRRNGYSDLEIAQKREALENVLIPYHHHENVELLRSVGFNHVDVFFKWYNFCGFMAIK